MAKRQENPNLARPLPGALVALAPIADRAALVLEPPPFGPRMGERRLVAPSNMIATDAEVLRFINGQALFGRGIGYVDVHLLASVRLTAGAQFWTWDTRLRSVAEELGLAMAS